MKKIFTKCSCIFLGVIIFLGVSLSARAQFTTRTLESNNLASAIAKDASGNIYVLRFTAGGTPGGGGTGEVVKYTNGTGTAQVIYSGIRDVDEFPDDFATGLVVASNGDIYLITDNDLSNNFYGIITKLTFNGGTSYTPSTFQTGTVNNGYYSALAIDANDNLYAVQYNLNADSGNGGNGAYEVVEYPAGSLPNSAGTVLYQKLDENGLGSGNNYSAPTGLAINSIGDIYVADSFDNDAANNDGGHILKLTKLGGYAATIVSSNFYASALAVDASDNLYSSQSNGTNYALVEYPSGSATQTPNPIYSSLNAVGGDLFPFGIAIINNTSVFLTDGLDISGNNGKVLQLIGPPTTQATNVAFTNITSTTATASWTNGTGSSRAVFIKQTSTLSSPVPVNSTTYTAASAAYTTGTQIGVTGWYCIYNGTGSTVDITGLTSGQAYYVMAVEYNGVSGSENYLTTPSTNNPNTFTATPPITTINSIALAGSSLTNATSVSYTVTFGAAITGLTISNFALAGAGATGASIASVTAGPASVYTVTVNTGNDGALGLNLQNSTSLSSSISTTLPFTGSVYTIDKTPPAADPASEIFVSSNSNVRAAKVGDVITLSFTTTEPIQTPVITIDGHSVTPSNPSGNNWSVTYTMVLSDTEGPVSFDVQAQDLAGNAVDISSAALPPQFVITFDKTAPAISIGAPSVASIGTGTGSVTYPITYVDANLNSITLAPGDITLNTTGDATGTVSVVNSTSSSVVTIAGITGSGSIGISIGAGTANDVAGNSAPVAGPSTTFAVVLNPQTITFNALPTKTYGDADFPPGATSDNAGIPITYTSDNPAVATIVAGDIHIVGAGSANITASQAGDATHSAATDQIQALTVNAATLTITADNQTKAYGAALPALTVSYSGLVNGDTQASLTTQPTLTTTATAASHVAGSPYAITASGAVDPNYTISYAPGALTITAAPLTITADNQTKAYGAALPTLTASYSGLVNGDTGGSLTTLPTLSTTATAASSVAGSPYAITASGAVDPDYAIAYVPGSLTITAAALTIIADNQTKVYGSALPTLTASYTGFVNGDTPANLTTAPTLTTTATNGSHIAGNPYAITASGAVDPDYTISYVPGSLTVTTAPLTITADNQTKAYGAALPTLTVTYSGLVNGDSSGSLTTLPTLTTTATAASTVAGNPYPISASGAVDADYTISYVDGNLTIGTASLTITADNQTKTYGAALPVLTATYTGFVNGDNTGSLTTAPTLSTTATAATPVGAYPIGAAGAVDPNYTISYTLGTLTIGQAALTITADNQTKAYGAAVPTLTASYNGFVNGDNATSLATTPMITTTATMGSLVAGSPYPITASGAVDNNYTISYVDGNLTIGAVPLTITANNQTKTAGTANPPLTVSYTGFVNGDMNTNLATQPVVITTATTGSPAGPYPITASGAADANYTISYVAGTLTIAPVGSTASVIAFAPIPQKTYGNTDFAPGATSNNNVTPVTYTSDNTAVATIVSGKVHIVGAGTANITAMQAAGGTFTAASNVIEQLNVVPSALTITANNQTKIAGTANPPLTVSYTGFVNGDTNTSLATQPVVITTATTGSPAGPYPITASGAADANYTISYVAGTLTIAPVGSTASVIAFAPIPQKTYGNTDFAPGATSNNNVTPVTYTSDNTAVATIVSGKVHIVGAGTANITAMQAAGGTFTAASNVIQQLKVVPEAITVTANAESKTFGQPDPALTYTVTIGALVGTDAFTGALTRVPGEATGSYAIKQGTLALSSNYTLTYIGANLVIGQKVLTITASNQTKVYGSANPALTVSYSGFVNGDTQASLTTKPTLATTAITNSGANTYPISVSGAAITGYTIVYVPGTLTVTKAVLTVTADNQTRNYGEANPALTVVYSGFVNGDDISSLGSPAVAATTATATTAPGSYPITVNDAVSANYSFNYVSGTLVIKPLTNANLANLTLSSGILSPAFDTGTLAYTSFVENSADQITLTPTLSDATATVRVNSTLTANGTSSADIPLNVGSNVITVEVTAQDGITKLDYTVTVTRDESILAITATNILTPNGDGKNDTWVIQDIQHYPNNSVIVYDRAGRVVYNKNGYTNDWGGTLGGVPLNEGTYYYVVNLGPGLRTFKGFISILRSN